MKNIAESKLGKKYGYTAVLLGFVKSTFLCQNNKITQTTRKRAKGVPKVTKWRADKIMKPQSKQLETKFKVDDRV